MQAAQEDRNRTHPIDSMTSEVFRVFGKVRRVTGQSLNECDNYSGWGMGQGHLK
jgi:hypothetical protein